MANYIDIFGETYRCSYTFVKGEKEETDYPGTPDEVNDLVIYDENSESITDEFTDHEIELIKEKIIEIESE